MNTRLKIFISIALAILLIPLVAMQFTEEVNWSFFDFAVAAFLLIGFAVLCDWILRKVKNQKYRMLLCALAVGILVIIWLELAVGIFGSPLAGN